MAVDVAPQAGVVRGSSPIGQDTTGVSGVDSFGNDLVSADSRKPCYNFSVSAFAAVATPTAVVVVQGSASKTVRIRKIWVTGAATAAGTMPVVLTRRSTAGTLGSAVLTGITASKMDINDPAVTAVASTVGTANYTTLGTTAGIVATGRVCMTALGSGLGVQPLAFEFGKEFKSCVLRGASDFLTIDFGGAAIPSGGVLDITVHLEEDAS
jgi:hypothetical protein